MNDTDKIGHEIHSITESALVLRLESIIETLKYRGAKSKKIAIKKIQTLQSEIKDKDIMPF